MKSYDEALDDIRSAIVKSSVAFLKDHSPLVRATFLYNAELMPLFMKSELFTDVWLPHMFTYFNESDIMLK